MIIGNYLQEHEIQAFCRRTAEGTEFKQVIQAENSIIFLANRNGVTSIEKVDTTKKTAHAMPSISYSAVTGVIDVPQPQYDGKYVNVYDGNGDIVGTEAFLVEDGKITIPVEYRPSLVSEVGFNIHSRFESNPLNIGIQTKTLFKTINTIKIAVTDESRTEHLKVNGKYGRREENLVTFVRPARPLKDCRFIIENDVYPVEILSMELDIEA